MSETTETAVPASEVTADGTVLDRILGQGKLARDPSQRATAIAVVEKFVDQVLARTPSATIDIVQQITDCIAELDDRISAQLNEVMHHQEFQKLEASWRGLHDFVMATETGTQLKLRLMNATKAELLKDLKSAVEFDQSALFKKVYEEEYGTFGGNPYSMLVGDYEFGPSSEDILFLTKISNVAAAAHAPFMASVSPSMFFMDSFTELPAPRDLAKIFESSDMAEWRAFRESEDSRYVALTMPHVLQRRPYGPDGISVEGLSFVEDVDGSDHKKYLWGNAAYKLAQRVTYAFSLYGWTAAIRGVEGGGKVEGLPAHSFRTPEGDKVMKCPTETAITDRREMELSDLGFVSLIHHKGATFAAFFGGQTTQKPRTWNTASANANARLSARLPYVLTASRIAHYLKVIMRDKVGSFVTKENVQTFLNTWIGDYVLGKDDAGQSLKARYPLREARVDVFDTPGKPGVYTATVFLRPHFQLEELTASIRLVAELPPPVAA
jgi:type VI secretion system protein ImpC